MKKYIDSKCVIRARYVMDSIKLMHLSEHHVLDFVKGYISQSMGYALVDKLKIEQKYFPDTDNTQFDTELYVFTKDEINQLIKEIEENR